MLPMGRNAPSLKEQTGQLRSVLPLELWVPELLGQVLNLWAALPSLQSQEP